MYVFDYNKSNFVLVAFWSILMVVIHGEGNNHENDNHRSWKLPEVFIGIGVDEYGFNAIEQLEAKQSDADQAGWTKLIPSIKLWTHPTRLPRFGLRYDEGHLSGMVIEGPPSPVHGKGYYDTDNFFDITFRDPDDRNTFQFIANGFIHIPSTFQQAEQEGWIEGGCAGFMGGSHYYKLESGENWIDRNPITPIYNKYGGAGELAAVVIHFGNVYGSSAHGFDLGGIPVYNKFRCWFNYCGNSDCLQEIADATNLADATQTLHILFKDYPLEPVECQAPGCDIGLCSCCNSGSSAADIDDEESYYTNCAPIDMMLRGPLMPVPN